MENKTTISRTNGTKQQHLLHNGRCEASMKKRCVCSCGGSLHGMRGRRETALTERDSKPVHAAGYGGEVEQYLNSMQGKYIECWCGEKLPCVGFEVFNEPHDGGLKDKDGTGWWVYLHCDKCGYDWAFWKVARRAKVNNTSMEDFITQ